MAGLEGRPFLALGKCGGEATHAAELGVAGLEGRPFLALGKCGGEATHAAQGAMPRTYQALEGRQ
ncbi:MAG: hypothetical protein ACYC0X_33195 [Pirellulaceae bacterium]